MSTCTLHTLCMVLFECQLQRGPHYGSPAPASWLGISPPTRTTGAVNPLVQDFNWRSNAYRWGLTLLS